ncbi:GGDEF domain-containing protein [Acidithiobacillus caldus]|nr:GGDEF domain-containing protein [Acidithiobacillus caldus]QER43202.1 hypothetical protein F0726_00110 [Acidithiobacillus caldus]
MPINSKVRTGSQFVPSSYTGSLGSAAQPPGSTFLVGDLSVGCSSDNWRPVSFPISANAAILEPRCGEVPTPQRRELPVHAVNENILFEQHIFYSLLNKSLKRLTDTSLSGWSVVHRFCDDIVREIGPISRSTALLELEVPELNKERRNIQHSSSQMGNDDSDAAHRKIHIYCQNTDRIPCWQLSLKDNIKEIITVPLQLEFGSAKWLVGSDRLGFFECFGTKHFQLFADLLGLVTRSRRMAQQDPLTKLPNRAYLQPRLAEAQARSERSGRKFAVVLADLDNFKQVNDTLGHGSGDELLMQVSQCWRSVLRPTDVLLRLGGDEFVMILEEMDRGQLERVLDRIASATGNEFRAAGRAVPIGVSMGVAISSGRLVSESALLRRADKALYIAKSKKSEREKCYRIHPDFE